MTDLFQDIFKKNIGDYINKNNDSGSLLVFENFVFFSDEKGKIYKFDTNGQKIIWELKIYESSYNNYPKNIALFLNDDVLFAADNLGFIYSIDAQTGKTIWQQNYGIPFSSHLLGKYSYSKTAIIFFALNIILIGISLFSMRQYVISSKTIENSSFTKTENEHANMHILFPVVSAFIAIFVSFYSTKIAILLFTIAILFNLSKNGTKYIFYLIDIFRKKKKEETISSF